MPELSCWPDAGVNRMSQPLQPVRFCTSRDGVRLAYASSGTGPALVWVPHWVHNLECDPDSPIWGPWLDFLAQSYSTITYDWRGCGLSDRERVNFAFNRLVEDLEAVVRDAGVHRFVLFGMASGAAVSVAYAVRHPEQVSHLVLYGSMVSGRLVRSSTQQQQKEAETRLKVIELGWRTDLPGYAQFFTSLHLPDASAEQVKSYNEQLRLTTTPANAAGLLKTFFDIDLRSVAPNIRCPTLVIHAHSDSVVEFEEGRAMASLIRRARFVPLQSRNHIVLNTEPAWSQLIKEMDAFLPGDCDSSINPVELRLPDLTAREREILELVAQGTDNAGIASLLGLSKKTVRNQVSIIVEKLGVDGRLQAVIRAREAGLGRNPVIR